MPGHHTTLGRTRLFRLRNSESELTNIRLRLPFIFISAENFLFGGSLFLFASNRFPQKSHVRWRTRHILEAILHDLFLFHFITVQNPPKTLNDDIQIVLQQKKSQSQGLHMIEFWAVPKNNRTKNSNH
jgi:hypothetical protein